jgi:hypothetical protein
LPLLTTDILCDRQQSLPGCICTNLIAAPPPVSNVSTRSSRFSSPIGAHSQNRFLQHPALASSALRLRVTGCRYTAAGVGGTKAGSGHPWVERGT